MNARDYKPNFEGACFHSYNRGVNKNLIFLDDQDYQNFIFRAKILLGIIKPPKRTAKGGITLKPLVSNALEILCYCLMPNHFHFLIKQNLKNAQKIFFHRLCTSYSAYFNKKYKRFGNVFQDIYKSKNILEDSYLTQLTGYIHLNPQEPFLWKYSSLQEYLGKEQNGLSNPEMFMKMHNLDFKTYESFLIEKYDLIGLQNAQILFEEE